jgi:hypothetical protein
MTPDQFHLEMAAYQQSAHDEANSLKSPYIALERLRTLYGKLDANERGMADQILSDWVLPEDEGVEASKPLKQRSCAVCWIIPTR